MISQQRLGQAIRELRKEAQLTQQGLAHKSGVAKQAISNIERGAAFDLSADVTSSAARDPGRTSPKLCAA